MNDPHARAVLHVAASDLAADLNGGRLRRAAQAENVTVAPPAAPGTDGDAP